MKNIILILLIACPFILQAQTITESVQKYYVSHTTDTLDISEPIDSIVYDTTFTYTFILTEVSEDGRDTTITKRGGLTEVEVQAELYSAVNTTFNNAARLKAQAAEELRKRVPLLQALNDIGLNNYYADTRTRVRQQLNGNWLVRSNGNLYNCTISNNTGALRTNGNDTSGQPTNTLIARLVPRSDLFISIAFEPGFGTDTEVSTLNWSNYVNDDLTVRLKYNK